jgi:hypothetical protein
MRQATRRDTMTTETEYEIIKTSAAMIEKGDVVLSHLGSDYGYGLITWKHLSHRGKVSIRYGEEGRTFFRGADPVVIKRKVA